MKIALVLNDDFSMWHFRKGLISALRGRGHAVYVITPYGPYVSKLERLGAIHVAVHMERFIRPLRDLRLICDLYRVFWRHRFDVVHNMTVKPNIYGSVAAWVARVPRVVGLANYALGLS